MILCYRQVGQNLKSGHSNDGVRGRMPLPHQERGLGKKQCAFPRKKIHCVSKCENGVLGCILALL